ncbi:MAG TPA: hypothetical protein VMT94_06230 [Burkholderiales bacterium]|nr:hypothetical protein [Burkholderiales bacterium]
MKRRFFLCIKNRGYQADLLLGKVYHALPAAPGDKAGWLRIVDDSGEDYYYPEKYFLEVELPAAAQKAVIAIAKEAA